MPPFVRTLIFTLLVPVTVVVWLPLLLDRTGWPGRAWDLGPFRYLGWIPLVLGASGYLACAWDFSFRGRGTPAPIDPPRFLVRGRLYRFVRNPMYVCVGLVLTGESLLFGSAAPLFLVTTLWPLFHLFVVLYEEPTLRRKFGAEYEQYLREVPRWIPRLRS